MKSVAAVCLLAVWIVKGPAYRAAHVRRVPRALPYQTLIHEVGAFVATGTPLTAEERAFLERALPLSTWRATYACASGNALMRSGMQPDALLHDPFSLPVLWVRLALRDPWTLLHHWSCATRFVWSPRSDLSVACDVTPNPFGIAARPLVPGAERLLAGVVRATLVPDSLLRVLVWQPALPLYAVLAALAASLRRARSTTPVLVFLPALCNTLVWLVLPFAPDSRFQWPVTLFAPVALCLAALDWRRVGGAAGA